MFRRRHRDDADLPAPQVGEDEYPADSELAEQEDYLGDEDEDEDGDDLTDDFGPGEPQDAAESESEGERRGRRSARADRADLGDPTTWTRLRDTSAAEPAHTRSEGPWDSGDSFPEAERIDLGCLLIPVRDGSDVHIGYSDETGVSVAVVAADSALQLQPFAAPRSSGLWQEVRPEIAAEVASAGGRSEERQGPFGPELLAWVEPPELEGQPSLPPQPLRFLGVDGPRWFLRGLISGPAAIDAALARPLEEVFAEVVVVRGDYAVPPRQPLQFQLPAEAQQLFDSQQEQEQEQQSGMPNPFERGPEITETR